MREKLRENREKIRQKREKVVGLAKAHKIFLSAVIILLLGLTYNYISGGLIYVILSSDVDSITTFIQSFGVLAALVYFILIFFEVVLAPVPSLVLYVAGGVLFGTLWGGTIALIANMTGSIVAFMIARKYARGFVEKAINKKKLVVFDEFSHKYGGYAIFFLRLNPLTSTDLISYFAGLSLMPMKDLILGTFFGILPSVFIQAYLGEGFIKNNPVLMFIFLMVSVVYIALFVYAAYMTRKSYVKEKNGL